MVLESNTLDVLFVKDGQQGEDGKVLYTWIKYAKDANGTGMTDDPNGAIYIGISYNNESSIESNDPTQYAWTKIQGAEGKKGEDAYTIFLENENISFATDENRDPLSEQAYTSGITIMKGAKPVTDFTIGDISKTQGIAVAKTDTAIAISVINGNPLPSDNGEIVIPITVGGTVFKKILSWTCSKKGDKGIQGIQGPQGVQGEKGQDGTSVKITSKSVTYQTSTSGTTAPTGTWVTTVPTVNNGQYLWTKTTVQYSDGNKTEAYSVSYKGTNGTNGTSVTVSKTEVTYQVSTSGTTAPTGTWSTTMPSCDQGQYLWTKTYVKYSDGKDTTSYSVSYKGVDGEKFAFNMLRETNQGSKHWVNMGASGKYSVESITTEDSINAVKLICTEPIASNEWQFCDFSDYEMLKSLKASTTYTLSYDIKTNRSGKILHNIKTGGGQKVFFANDIACKVLGNETWEHVSLKMTSGTTLPNLDGQVIYMFGDALSKVGYSIIKNLKLTEGIIDTPWAPHPEDLEGRGVSETVQYYLATSQASGVTSSTSGWSTDITTQKLTADKKYLWNCYQTKYSDGTSEPISTPKVIGVYGDKGQNAKNLSITPSSQYFKSTDGGKTFAPNTITIKPTIQGEISFGKWQYSIDGGVSFADVVSGQKGLTVSNNVLTVSKDSSLYSDAVTMVTFRAVANDSSFYDTCSIAKIYDVSDIGDGRNLLWNSNFAKTDEAITGTTNSWGLHTRGTNLVASIDTSTKHNGFNTLKTVSAANGDKNSSNDLEWFAWGISERTSDNLHSKNQNYTLSFYAKASVTTDFIVRWGYDAYGADTTRTLTTNWQKYEIKLHQATSAYSITIIFKLLTAGTVWFSEFKLEKGSSATGYSTAPEDLQTAILSTKSEISDVSLKVDNNKQAIEQRVEKTTYQQDLKLVKGDISKANEGLNKWRYEIYPKSLFTSEYQGKSTMDVFAKNTNLTPSQSVLINDTDFGKKWAYGDNYIGYALTFVKFSATKSVAITFKHDDGAHLYLNGKLIGGDDTCNTGSGESLTLSFIQGWNCLEVVLNEKSGGEYIGLGTTISAISECQLMNCYYGTPVARQSHITNQLVQNTTDIDGVSGSVQKVMSTVGGSGKIDEFVSNYATWKKKVDGIETRVGETYTTKDDFDDLQIGGRNLLKHSSMIGEKLICDNYFICNNCNIQEYTNDGFHIITPTEGNANNGIAFAFDNFTIMEINGGDTITFSCDIKGTSDSHAPFVSIHISDNNWYGSGVVQKNTNVSITKDWQRVSVTITTPTGLTKNHMWLAIHGNHQSDLYVRNFKLEKGNKPTDWTPAPEDVNGKIVNVETIANQTADKFSWIVKSGTSSSNFEITDRLMNLVSANINLDGIVSFMNTAKGDGRKNLYNLDYSSFENVASQEDAICYAKDNGVTSVGIDSSVSYDGDKSLKISYTTANLNSSTTPLYLGSSANNYGCVKIQAGKQYILSCYVKSDSTTGLFMIDIQGHDTPDTKTDGLYLSNIDPRKLPGSSTGVNLSTDWQRAVCAIKVADNATGLYWSVVPLIWGRPSSSSAPQTFNVWVDCIMLEEVDSISNEPGTYIFDKETIIDGGSIKTDTITGNQILAGSITADKIATDAIKSHNYISSGGTQGSFLNLGDGSFTSPNLSWDSNGNLIAKNANLSGQITATKGSIGGWSVDNYSIYTTYDSDQNIFGSGISGTKGKYVLWAGETNNAIGANRSSDTPTDASLVIYNNGGLEVRKTMVGNDKKNHLYTTILQSGQINLKMDDNYIGTITATDTISSNSTVTMSHVSMAAKKGYGWSILHTDDSGNLISDIQRDPGDTKIKIRSPITVSSTDITKYNAIETTGDVVVNGKIHANYGPNRIQFNPDNNGSIELYGGMPFIDFHFACSNADYTSRIISQHDWDCLTFTGSILLGGTIYNSSGGHYTWDGKDDAYISCGNYSGGNNIYYYANYHAFYVNNDSGSGMMYINTNGVTSRVGFTKTSDERIKKNFESFDDNIIDAYMNIEPVKYQLKQSSNDKYHFGFKAQHIDKVFSDYGDIYNESFDICTSRPIDPDKAKELYGVDGMVEEYGLRYDELIAPTTYMVQHTYKELESTKNELEQVKQEKADLETRLQAIEAKLGL